MKSIFDGTNYLRVSDEVAEQKVKTGKFKYISKTTYKNNVSVIQTTKQEIVVKEQKKSDKLQKRMKLKENQR